MKKLILINPHDSPCLRGKGLGLLECIWEHVNVLQSNSVKGGCENPFDIWIKENNLRSPEIIGAEDINGASLVFDLRYDYCKHGFVEIFKKLSSVIVYANHFMVARDNNVKILGSFDGEVHVLLENATIKDDFIEYILRGRTAGVFFYVVSPATDSRRNDSRFELAFSSRISHNKCVMLTGAIYKHKVSRSVWWQEKYKVNDYFPDRSIIHEMSRHFQFESFSKVVADYSNDFKYLSFFSRLFNKIKAQAPAEHEYYSFSLPDAFSQHSFVFVPSDIFGVVPQSAFQAMLSGAIVVGSSSPSFSSLGFQDGVNYLSVGDDWNLCSLDNFFKRINSLSLDDIEEIASGSKSLVSSLKRDDANNINECLCNAVGICPV